MTNDQIAALAIIVGSIFILGYCVLRAFGAHEPERRLYPPPPGVQEWRDEHWGAER